MLTPTIIHATEVAWVLRVADLMRVGARDLPPGSHVAHAFQTWAEDLTAHVRRSGLRAAPATDPEHSAAQG